MAVAGQLIDLIRAALAQGHVVIPDSRHMSPQQSRSLIGAFHVLDPNFDVIFEKWIKSWPMCEFGTGCGQAKPGCGGWPPAVCARV
jgi:hypothetical protein